ncbi:hypothetical protein M409DRAFT_51263 [Zasmidium cellare ATCC 36951]|uniref:Ubiquitin 3 binding protein But2 C-terminal domain-containing protein n=1 Tax=Zasmidium cellare ATCC 36951 TaxID=1080233 RepID=A0A6A6CYS1_ZASCE|nr:uncharacterized protein M409DRAFT_51263 [Zasmidium cellare ATCC 36951]KAF2171032.1 hypothetical protein M409DRAFT_51263 [Zasmidium cellare ATCC 36951]
MALKDSIVVFLLVLFNAIKPSYAQANLNLTVTFYPDTSDSCNSTSNGISFTTASVPNTNECFNLADLFAGNSTFGFRNQTPSTSFDQDSVGLYWRIENVDAYDSQANYSNVLYQQPVTNDNDGEAAGTDAVRYLSVYNAPGCIPSGEPEVQPWVGWTCSSSAEGECGALPYSVASFKVDDASAVNERDGKCWNFALSFSPYMSSLYSLEHAETNFTFSCFIVVVRRVLDGQARQGTEMADYVKTTNL